MTSPSRPTREFISHLLRIATSAELPAKDPVDHIKILDEILEETAALSLDRQRALASHESITVKAALAFSSKTEPSVLEQLNRLPEDVIQQMLVGNPNTPPVILTTACSRFVKLADLGAVRKVASNPNTPSETLEVLRNFPDAGTLVAVVSHRNTSLKVIEGLLGDPNRARAAAANPNITTELLALAVESNDWMGDSRKSPGDVGHLYLDVARNPKTSSQTLHTILERSKTLLLNYGEDLPQTLIVQNVLLNHNLPLLTLLTEPEYRWEGIDAAYRIVFSEREHEIREWLTVMHPELVDMPMEWVLAALRKEEGEDHE